ncbi:DUF488 domain-containing protein [Arthrobacter rhombi]|uniref:DUF488 domain-containing protein n=1 Tax=Arthrobacter rhombi TaxID=71253 RepID=UPI003FD301E9
MVSRPRRLCIYTIGHSTHELSEVVKMLRENKVDMLCDVRSYPSSRKFPQWYRKAIIENLPDDIGYQWLQDLGGRRHTPAGVESPNGAWRVKAFRDYADYMATDGFRTGLEELISIAAEHTVAIMCSEAVPWRCHRRLITDALLTRDIEVRHIMSPTSTKPATLTEWAVNNDGELTYPAQEK